MPKNKPLEFTDIYKDATVFEYHCCEIIFDQSLGEGTAMNVYEGSCKIDGIEREVAFKIPRGVRNKNFNPSSQEISSILKTLGKEIKYMKRLNGVENVVQFHGLTKFGNNDRRPILILELATGNLEEYLRNNMNEEQNWDKILNFCLQIAKGANEMHNKRVIHGDLKGSNILVFINKEGNVTLKLCDFGFSSSLSSSMGNTGRTKQFTAPECLPNAQEHPDLKCFFESNLPTSRYNRNRQFKDVYSYGLIVWQIAVKGETPFSSLNERDIVKRKMKGDLNDLLRILPKDIPEFHHGIIMSTTKFKPKERGTFQEIIDRINKYLEINLTEWEMIDNDDIVETLEKNHHIGKGEANRPENAIFGECY